MRGQSRFFQILPFGIRCAIMATIAGDIFDAGSFPALDLAGQSFVAGDIFVLDSLSEFLSVADRIEGFRGFGAEGSLFKRTITEVDVGGAGPRLVFHA